jgi:hypothetical protein
MSYTRSTHPSRTCFLYIECVLSKRNTTLIPLSLSLLSLHVYVCIHPIGTRATRSTPQTKSVIHRAPPRRCPTQVREAMALEYSLMAGGGVGGGTWRLLRRRHLRMRGEWCWRREIPCVGAAACGTRKTRIVMTRA